MMMMMSKCIVYIDWLMKMEGKYDLECSKVMAYRV